MAAAVLLQEWTTVRGNAATTTVTQQEHHYADLVHFQDVSVYLECSDVSGNPTISFMTSPTRDDNLFQPVDATGTFVPVAGSVMVRILRYANCAVPLARFLRWKFTGGTGAWSCTFRVWLSPNLS